MKHLISLLLVVATCVFGAKGQKLNASAVPAVVKNAFEKKYQGMKAAWDKEDANYEANFTQNGNAASVLIDKNGIILETETEIPVTDLPRLAQDYIKTHYPTVKTEGAARIVKANGEINYEAEVHHKDVVFDANGKFIKEVKD